MVLKTEDYENNAFNADKQLKQYNYFESRTEVSSNE